MTKKKKKTYKCLNPSQIYDFYYTWIVYVMNKL